MTATADSWYRRLFTGWEGSGGWSETHPVTAPPVRQSQFSAELASRDPGLAFTASFELFWQGEERAVWATLRDLHHWAADISRRYCVAQTGYLQAELNALVGQRWARQIDTVTRIVDAKVRVAASHDVLTAYTEMQSIKRRAAIERLRWETDLEELAFLREKVFSRPDVARSYWLNRHLDKPDEFGRVPFDEIAEAFGASSKESMSARIGGLIEEFLGGLDEGQRNYLVVQLGQVFSSYLRPDLAKLLDEAREDRDPDRVPE
ncbi:hypothetical protein AB0M36_32635 [Actinoplanes sp. NPDC051346]|uniref:hypothetical protein n=1 Tax=Actinoplanes sp. NPDC051346 TaxID=3155048 RepID=UPI003434D585